MLLYGTGADASMVDTENQNRKDNRPRGSNPGLQDNVLAQ